MKNPILPVLTGAALATPSLAAFQLAGIDFGSADGLPNIASGDFIQHSSVNSETDIGVTGQCNDLGGSEGFGLSSGLWNSGTGIDISFAHIGPVTVETISGRHAALGSDPSGNQDIIIGNTLRGGWIPGPPFPVSGDNGLGGLGSVLVARLSVETGQTIDFAGAEALITLSLDGGISPTVFESRVNDEPLKIEGQFFVLRSVFYGSGSIEGVAVDTYDIYVEEVETPSIPAPASALLLGAAFCLRNNRRP